ncbi:hypothetical protein ISS07_04180 [Candidatus Woesearchaeota archaeon]|nr:hypothetical protein [Candidatus Woesearchaeota archaeon]
MVLHIKTGLLHVEQDPYLEQLQELMVSAFGARGCVLDDNYFDALKDQDIAYVVMDVESEAVNGAILALHKADETVGNYLVLDKIAVSPEKWGNGTLSGMFNVAKDIRHGQDQEFLPTLWRTSDEGVSEAYKKFSDKSHQIGNYFVHAFGIQNPNQFDILSNDVAGMPTTITLESRVA